VSILALDVGGTYVRSAWVQGSLVTDDQRVHTDLSGIAKRLGTKAAEEVFHLLVEHIRARLGEGAADAVAIGVPGFIDKSGTILASPNIPGVVRFPLRGRMEEALDLRVIVANDALCAAQGQWILERPQPPSLAILTLGTGVGGGLILDGRPVVGDGGTAMEIGHITVVPGGLPCGCGKQGCLEQYASASGLTHQDAVLHGTGRDAAALALAARNGDIAARKLFHHAGSYLGKVLADLALMTDVRTIRIGGGVSRSWDLIEPEFANSLAESLIPPLRGAVDVSPVPESMIDQIGILGAAHLAQLIHAIQ
jgi:glucokinase